MRYWLFKSEPDVFSLDDLISRPDQTEPWDGIRNFQARNFIRDDMRVGQPVLFYHSRCAQPGIVGLAEIVREAYPDPTAFDPESPYFDPKSDPANPRWLMVDVKYKLTFEQPVSLTAMKANPALAGMLVTRRGQRLSIQPVEEPHFRHILQIGTPGL